MKNSLIGLLFAMLWASASVATKFGVLSAEPLVLANIRFFIAGFLLLGYSYLLRPDPSFRLPQGNEWRHLALFGFLNTTLYLGLYVYALRYTAAGIGSLAVSTNPLLIIVMSAWWMGRKPSGAELLGVLLGMVGVGIATYPLLRDSYTTLGGIILLMISMLAVSVASVYYATIHWKLPNLLINGWQVTIGGLLLLPFTGLISDFSAIQWDERFWWSVLWLSLAVSVGALLCWFYLLRIDTVRASLWLFLCPLFGFFYAWWLMGEPITVYTYAGTALVIGGLYMAQRKKINKEVGS
ncbi:DMT family transporter [Telluribacter sp. SYSU D00476]|uniref:DMT family transporter n=1 Tax=Telluribacter sp. SYSU D00476 TaxID=2811430 RepID=UPI001FF437FF|nr:DMT family transporter [Telluribacter sp. SYSU D00476]